MFVPNTGSFHGCNFGLVLIDTPFNAQFPPGKVRHIFLKRTTGLIKYSDIFFEMRIKFTFTKHLLDMDRFLEMFETLHFNVTKGIDILFVSVDGKDKFMYIVPNGTGKISRVRPDETTDVPVILMFWKKEAE